MVQRRLWALVLALALSGSAHSALAQTAAAAGPVTAPALDSAALVVATDANPTMYAAAAAEAPPAVQAAPAVAVAPQAGVSAWEVPSETQSPGGLWSTQRLLEAAVGLSFLVLVFFFIINSTRQAFENWEVEKSGGEGGLKGQGGGPGDYGTLGESFREASGLYPVKFGGYAPHSPALPVGLRNKSSSGNLEGMWDLDPDEEQGGVDPWELHQSGGGGSSRPHHREQPSRVRHDSPAGGYRRESSASRVASGDRQSSRVPSGERMAQQQQQPSSSRGPPPQQPSSRGAPPQQAPPRVPSGSGGGSSSSSSQRGGSSSHHGQSSSSSRSGGGDAQHRSSASRGSSSQQMPRGPYQPPPRNL